MSIYLDKRSQSGVYLFDFQIGGERFSGSTGKARKREAEAEEQRLKDEARKKLNERKAWHGPRLTMEQACERFWSEKQADYVNRKDLVRWLAWLTDYFGRGKWLDEIDDNAIAQMVARRRGEIIPNRKTQKLVSNSTVNRTAIQPLQWLMNRAHKVWKLNVQPIDWARLMLREPQERIREASDSEERALLRELGFGYDVAVKFALRMGARRMEILNLNWTDVDFFSTPNRLTLNGKGGKKRVVPLPADMRELLWAEKNNHPVKVFTYVARKTATLRNGEHIVRGQRYPLQKEAFVKAWRRACQQAGIVDYRFHDNRHTAATRLLRETGNLRHVQNLLGHADIQTTTKYAHSTLLDLADALEGAAPGNSRRDEIGAKSPRESPREAARPSASN